MQSPQPAGDDTHDNARPNVPDRDTFHNIGSGSQYNNTGNGFQVNNTGSGSATIHHGKDHEFRSCSLIDVDAIGGTSRCHLKQ